MTTRPLVVATLAVMIAGCSDPPTAPVDRKDGLIPLMVGAEWTYSIADSGQKWYPDSVRTMRVTRDTVVGGVHWYHIENNEMIYVGPFTGFMANVDTGLVHLWSAQSRYQIVRLAYQYPPRLGVTFSGGSYGAYSMRAFVTDSAIAVPAGTFNCVGYEWIDGSGSVPFRMQFFAPEVGLIKDVTPISRSGSTILSARIKVLTSYHH